MVAAGAMVVCACADCAWDCAGPIIPVIALSVFGVIVAGLGAICPAELAFVTIARNAAVFGDGGGNETGPPTRGVRPVEGVRPVRAKGRAGS